MNTPRRKQRGITERGFATMAAGGSHHRGKPRSIGAVQNKSLQLKTTPGGIND
jgi:hypothetical protein